MQACSIFWMAHNSEGAPFTTTRGLACSCQWPHSGPVHSHALFLNCKGSTYFGWSVIVGGSVHNREGISLSGVPVMSSICQIGNLRALSNLHGSNCGATHVGAIWTSPRVSLRARGPGAVVDPSTDVNQPVVRRPELLGLATASVVTRTIGTSFGLSTLQLMSPPNCSSDVVKTMQRSAHQTQETSVAVTTTALSISCAAIH